MMFEKKFEDFLKSWQDSSFTFKARPHQSLIDHISNMFIESENYFKNKTRFPDPFNKYIYISSYLSILNHDLGKLLPHFQYKICSKIDKSKFFPLPHDEVKFSYHTLISALFLFYFCNVLKEKFGIKDLFLFHNSKNKETLSDEDFHIIRYISFTAILNHHSPFLIDYYIKFIEDFHINDLKAIFRYLKSNINGIQRFFRELIKNIEKKRENQIYEKGGNLIFLKLNYLGDIFVRALEKFEEELCATEVSSPLDVDVRYKIKEIFKNVATVKKKQNSFNPIDIYIPQMYVFSLLCDIDIWDARFSKKENPILHDHPFFSFIPPLNRNDIIENYVSKPFGQIKQNFVKFSPKKPKNIIDNLRNELFFQSNQEPLKIGKIYILNSPTGAGKTLTLLNISTKLYKKYQEEYNLTPKIIYSLPFVSIGTQVGEQILKIFKNNEFDSELLSSSLLTVDNYISNGIWLIEPNELGSDIHSEEKSFIQGKDARWLISTWRSRYIVTTFIKLFHTILKPTKRNSLKFHRLANSIIILDEVQCLPIEYWDIINKILRHCVSILNCTIILSTATQPAIIGKDKSILIAKDHLKIPVEIKVQSESTMEIGKALNRYKVHYFEKDISLEGFLNNFISYLKKNPELDTLLVLNTKLATIKCYQKLIKVNLEKTEIQILSTLVLPKHRQEKVKYIKDRLDREAKSKRLVVISTQVIEAGVDFSFQVVFRDFAPLDSIIQVAGRCNRNLEEDQGNFYIMRLINPKNEKLFFHQIYKSNNVKSITHEFLEKASEGNIGNHQIFGKYFNIDEPQLRKYFDKYFELIKESNTTKDLKVELKELKYYVLSQKFNLIKGYPNQAEVFLPIDQKSKEIHNKLLNRQISSIPSIFHLYTIILNESFVYNLIDRNLINTVYDSNQNVLYYYFNEDKLYKWYNKTTGFIYDPEEEIPVPLRLN